MNNSNKKIIILVLTLLVLVSGVSISYAINNIETYKNDSGEIGLYFKDNTNKYSYNLEDNKIVEFTINSKNVIKGVYYQIKLDLVSEDKNTVVNLYDDKGNVYLSEEIGNLEQDNNGYYILTSSIIDDLDKLENIKLELNGKGYVTYRILLDTEKLEEIDK